MAEYIDRENIKKMTTSYKNELGRLKADPFVRCGIETVEGFIDEQPTANVIPIPEGATNGDMIKAITGEDFSRGASVYNHDLMICEGEYYLAFNVDWWNAPYKKEVEE